MDKWNRKVGWCQQNKHCHIAQKWVKKLKNHTILVCDKLNNLCRCRNFLCRKRTLLPNCTHSAQDDSKSNSRGLWKRIEKYLVFYWSHIATWFMYENADSALLAPFEPKMSSTGTIWAFQTRILFDGLKI